MPLTHANVLNNEIAEALLRSGYLQEVRLERILKSRGYYVEANAAIEDPITKKSRELDIYALGAKKLSQEHDYLFPAILVECVNNPQPFAVFPKRVPWRFSFADDLPFSGLPVKFPDKNHKNSWRSISDFLKLDTFHHYSRGALSSQFCSFIRKQNQGEWMALHDDSHFESIQKLCLAVDQHISEHYKSWYFAKHEPINIQVYYPVLVLQGRLVEISQSRQGVKIRDSKHAHLIRSTVSTGKETTYHIDIVVESHFQKYLSLIESEVSRMANILRRNRKTVEESVNRIVKPIRRLRNAEKIRKGMEF